MNTLIKEQFITGDPTIFEDLCCLLFSALVPCGFWSTTSASFFLSFGNIWSAGVSFSIKPLSSAVIKIFHVTESNRLPGFLLPLLSTSLTKVLSIIVGHFQAKMGELQLVQNWNDFFFYWKLLQSSWY